jgi:hypothetical protein
MARRLRVYDPEKKQRVYRMFEIDGGIRERLDAVIHSEQPSRIPELVKAVLVDPMRTNAIALTDRFHAARTDTYARRLLHRDPAGATAVDDVGSGPEDRVARSRRDLVRRVRD